MKVGTSTMIVILCILYKGIMCIKGNSIIKIMIGDMILLPLFFLICKIEISLSLVEIIVI